jgi:hypothetical protein
MIADDQSSGPCLEQGLPCVRCAGHATEQFRIQSHDRPGKSRRHCARRGPRALRDGERRSRFHRRRAQNDFSASSTVDQRDTVGSYRIESHTGAHFLAGGHQQRAASVPKQSITAAVAKRENPQQTKVTQACTCGDRSRRRCKPEQFCIRDPTSDIAVGNRDRNRHWCRTEPLPAPMRDGKRQQTQGDEPCQQHRDFPCHARRCRRARARHV